MQYSAAELFCHILNGEYPRPLRTNESSVPFAPDKDGVVKITVDSHMSIQLTALRFINHQLITYLMFLSASLEMQVWFDIDDISSHKE